MIKLDFESIIFSERETFVKKYSDTSKGKGGQLFLFVELPDNPGAEDAIAHRIWAQMKDVYETSDPDDTYLSFEEALKSMNEVLEQESKKRESGSIGRFNALGIIVRDREIHFSQAGLAELFLLRSDRLLKISEETTDEINDSFTSVSSGQLTSGDVIFLTTRQYGLEDASIKEALQSDSVEKELKNLGKEEDLIGGAAFIHVDMPSSHPSRIPEPEIELEEVSVQSEPQSSTASIPDEISQRDNRGRFLKKISDAIPRETLKEVGRASANTAKRLSENVAGLIRTPSLLKNINKRYVLVIIILVVVLFGFGLVIQSGVNEEKEKAQYHETLLMEVKNSISIAEQRYLIGEKSDAQDFLSKAENMLTEIETAGFYQKEVAQYRTDIAEYRDSFDGVIRVKDPFVLADLSQKGSVDALGIIHTREEKNYIYEPRRLFETILEKVQDPLEIDPEEIVIAGWEYEDLNALVLMTQSGRIIEFKNGRFEFVGTSDPSWKRGVDIKSYSRFIYILDPPSGKIWKYSRLRSRYSNASEYNSIGDLTKAVSFAIDGNVYVLNRGGEILKFNKGEQQEFTIKDQPSTLPVNASRIFTHAEANNLYVLDPENSRVIVYSKDTRGVSRYQKQYIFESLDKKTMRDLYVDKSEQKLYILTANKLYLADL